LTKKQVKVLYVCPFAHYTGHFPYAAVYETQALVQAGAHVELLTFCGVQDNAQVKVPQILVRQHLRLSLPLYHLANLLRRWKTTQRLAMFLETWLALSVAIRLKKSKQFDILHLRDGEPFPFMVHLFNCTLKDYRWFVSLTGTNLIQYPPLMEALRKDFGLFVYLVLLRAVNSSLWKPVYRRSLARNRFVFSVQNELMKERFEAFIGGVLAGKVIYLPLGAGQTEREIPKEKARKYLGIKTPGTVLLSFGACHVGKDLETVFKALKDIPEVVLLQGGDDSVLGAQARVLPLAQKYGMTKRTVIRNYYIPEEEKAYYFFAADAMILAYTKQFLSASSLLWESCRFGMPVIASDNGQLEELVKASQLGLLFTAQDAASLRKAIMRFLSLKPVEIKKLNANCQRFNDEFSLGKWAQRCLEIYDSLLIR
jgi:glycosyltransferase involved in cell wall biosynthesis